ncbi:MAG: molybdopterin-guanine dinucleotide biosynthesis protein B [Maricaulaceae bacterium]|nr:molybdopterin-guanine dinucleotide biosynthesis protein B [Maricaulaceae bacterium]
MRVFGIIGRKNAGKTTLVEKLVAELISRGHAVSTIKHAHHPVDLDRPGKDTFRHREAGAREVVLATEQRIAYLSEHRGALEPPLRDIIGRMLPADLVIVEGFKSSDHPKLEVWRGTLAEPALIGEDAAILAVATDAPGRVAPACAGAPVLDLADIAAIAAFVEAHAAPAR